MQTYKLTIVARDGGLTPRFSTAIVTIRVVNDRRLLPPQWQLVNGEEIDDLTHVSVSEDAVVNTLITNEGSLRLVATSSEGQVQYHLSNNGPPELNGNTNFKIPSPNPFNDTSLMPIAIGRKIDASIVPSYVLRCRTFVSVSTLIFICIHLLHVYFSWNSDARLDTAVMSEI